MDVTHPARWLHLGSTPVHPVVLEYHQGMWHIHFGVHTHFIQYHASDPFWTKVNKLLRIIYFHNTAVAALLCHRLWWKSQTSTCQLILNSRRNSCFNKRSSIYQLWTSTSVNACNLLLPVHLFSSPSFFFLQTLHIYCSHTSHIVSASYSSSGSPGLNHGECLSSDIYGCFFQLAWSHVCRENMNGGVGWGGGLSGNGGSNYCTACLWNNNK